MIAIPARYVSNIFHNYKVLKYSNKAFHKIFGAGIKDTINIYGALCGVDNAYNKLMKII